MNQALLCSSLLLTSLVSAQTDAQAAPKAKAKLELGKQLPANVQLEDIDGKRHVIGDGKITVVNFWSKNCPIMKGWEPKLAEIHEKYTKQGVEFLMINSNCREGRANELTKEPAEKGGKPYGQIRSYLGERELPYTVLVDHGSKVAMQFQAKTTPDIFILDKDRRLVYRGLIALEGKRVKQPEAYLTDTLDALLAEKKVKPKATKPAGCTIKFPAKVVKSKARGS